VAFTISTPAARPGIPPAVGPTFQAIGPLAFGPDGMLYAGDKQSATIFALQLGSQASGPAPGTADVANIDQRIASMLGTAASEIAITDLAVHPVSRNAFISVMRGQGPDARPALLRVDGAGTIDLVPFEGLTYTSVQVPNPPAANPAARRDPRTQVMMDFAFADGRLYVSGLSNEEFASKLWSVPVPFSTVDRGASVEIYHGNHGQLETRAPVMAFVPYTVGGQAHIIAGYTCTPLVKFPVASLTSGEKVVGTTIAELGAGNQPIDMIVYAKDGRDYLLMANTTHGVMKIPTAGFATAAPITERIGGTAGEFERIPSLAGVEQLDKLDAQRTVVIARAETGARNLSAAPLP
jgi:hypothetical protein